MGYGQSLQLLFFAHFGQRHYLFHVPISRLSDQLSEEGVLVSDKGQWLVVFFHFSALEHQDLVVVHDSVQTMSDSDDCCLSKKVGYVFELGSDHVLDQLVCFFVDTCGGFVHKEHFGFALGNKRLTMRARAMQMSCFWPSEKLEPESSILL